MSWPALLKAKDNAKEIEEEISRLIKNHNSLTKKELAMNRDVVTAGAEDSISAIEEKIAELEKNLDDHRRYLRSKGRFLRRHYSRL